VVDITEISALVAAAGVVVGVFYYILEMRHQNKVRQTDLITRLSYDVSVNREFLEATIDVMKTQFSDYNDFVRKYGDPISRNQVPLSFMMVGNFFEQIGVLYRNKLIDLPLVIQLFPVSLLWEKMKPLAEGMRSEYNTPGFFEYFEYLHNEMKKREQNLQHKGES